MGQPANAPLAPQVGQHLLLCIRIEVPLIFLSLLSVQGLLICICSDTNKSDMGLIFLSVTGCVFIYLLWKVGPELGKVQFRNVTVLPGCA